MLRTSAVVALLSAAVFAPALSASGPLFISTNLAENLSGVTFFDDDAVSTTLDGGPPTVIFSLLGGDLDALHRTGPDTWLVSSLFNGNFNGTIFDDGDLVEINTTTGTATVVISNTEFSPGADISAISVLPNGNYLLSTIADASLGGATFTDGDLVEYDPDTGTASIFLQEGEIFDDGDGDIWGVHAFQNGTIMFTIFSDEVISNLLVRPGDAILFDPATGDVALLFTENNFADAANIDALYFEGDLPGGPNDCVGDFDDDGDVDLGDFGVFGAAFGSMTGDMNFAARADFDADGDVDLGDFGVFGAEFGRNDCLD